MPTVPQWVETLGADLAKIGALIGGLIMAANGIRRVWRWTSLQVETLETLQNIAAELRPNHGTSIRDSLDRIEARQVTHEQRWRIALYDHDKGIVELDGDGRLVWCNRTFREITGRDTEELQGTGWALAIAPEDRSRILEEWEDAVQHGRDYETTVTYLRDDQRVAACLRAAALRAEPVIPTPYSRRATDEDDSGASFRAASQAKAGKTGGWVAIVSTCASCPGQSSCIKRA